MRPRVAFARFIIRLGRFIQELALMIMKQRDLIAFSQRSYSTANALDGWSSDELIESGLRPQETELLKKISLGRGKILVLDVGGGREAIYFARKGFEVAGVDYVPEMVRAAEENARKRGLTIRCSVQEISRLDVPTEEYDIVWLSEAMYSCVPVRKCRVRMLRTIFRALKPGGHFICQFYWDPRMATSSAAEFGKKLFGALTFGNPSYEKGDFLQHDMEFLHAFSKETELREEFESGGFEVVALLFAEEGFRRGGAVLRKPEIS